MCGYTHLCVIRINTHPYAMSISTCNCVLRLSPHVTVYCVSIDFLSATYRVAKMHKMFHLNRSFSTKEPYNYWLSCAKRPANRIILRIVATLQGTPPSSFFFFGGGTSTNKKQAPFTWLCCIPFWFLRIIVIYVIFVFYSDVGDSDGLEGFALWVKVNAKGLTGSRELKTSWIHALSLQVLSLQDTATRCNMLRHAALHCTPCSTQSPQAYANSRRAGCLGATRQRQDIRRQWTSYLALSL